MQLGGAKPVLSVQLDSSAKPKTIRLIGTLQNNASLAELVKNELASEITPFYPPAGAYEIRRLAANGDYPAILIVAGGDAAGAEIGTRNLIRLLTAENWF